MFFFQTKVIFALFYYNMVLRDDTHIMSILRGNGGEGKVKILSNVEGRRD